MHYYVYKITNKRNQKTYIGCRSSDLIPEHDLGSVYFSSSSNKKFIEEQKESPDQFIYTIIKEHPTIEEACEHERKLIDEYDALYRDEYYNACSKGCEVVTSRPTKSIVSYLGELIKLARKEQGILQEELAERINVSRGLIQRIESGNTRTSIGVVFEACFVLGIPLMGCDKEHINNLTKMLSYINKLIPGKRIKPDLNDDF